MITLANVPLTPFTDAIRKECDQWWDAHAPDLLAFPGYLTKGIDHLPIPYPPARRPPRPGVLVWPTGASRWATLHHFVTGDQLQAIRSQVGGADVGGGTPTDLPLVIDDENGRTIEPSLWLLPPRPAFQSGADELYLITLVDDRYRWWLTGDQVAPTGSASWSALLNSLFTAIGITPPTVPTVPAAYKTPAARWNVGAKPLPLLIDAACAAIGLRVVVQIDGTVVLRTAVAAMALEESQWQLYQREIDFGGRSTVADISRSVPAKVAVAFPASGADPTIATKTLAALALSEYGGATGMPLAVAQVNADLLASGSGADQTAYTAQAATDYYRWSLSRVDAAFRLIAPWEPTGLEDRIEWEHRPDRVLSRVVRSNITDRNIHGDLPPATGGGGGTIGMGASAYLTTPGAFTLNLAATLLFSGTQFSWVDSGGGDVGVGFVTTSGRKFFIHHNGYFTNSTIAIVDIEFGIVQWAAGSSNPTTGNLINPIKTSVPVGTSRVSANFGSFLDLSGATFPLKVAFGYRGSISFASNSFGAMG